MRESIDERSRNSLITNEMRKGGKRRRRARGRSRSSKGRIQRRSRSEKGKSTTIEGRKTTITIGSLQGREGVRLELIGDQTGTRTRLIVGSGGRL